MATAVKTAEQPIEQFVEQHVEQPNVILHNVSWETYERLIKEHGEQCGTRFTYDEGTLQIMIISFEHESSNRTLSTIVEALADGFDIDYEPAGSTTFKRKDIKRGFEPDSCFYFHQPEAIRGKKRLDLTKDAPPDLIIEVDVTHGSLDRLPIFAAIGVAEVWRYENEVVKFFLLIDNSYIESSTSSVLPGVTSASVIQFIADSYTIRRVELARKVRAWASSLSNQPQPYQPENQ